MSIPRYILELIWEFQNRKNNLLSHRVVRKLIKRYDGNSGHNLAEDKVELGYGLIHYSLIVNLKPKRVLCIGSSKGFIPAICALACKENKKGHVDFVDAGYDKDNPNHWGGTGFWKKVNTKKHFSYPALSSWITTHIMTSKQFSMLGTKKTWQYIYIDADHSYKGVKSDYKLFWPRLTRGGYMVFHDILLKSHPVHKNFGVWKFWEEIKDKNKITIPYTYSKRLPSGLGILQK
jgi:hypothetical protein